MNTLLAEIYSTVIPSAPFIIAAYALLWVLLLVWVFIQFNKGKKLSQQLTLLEEELDELKRKQTEQ